MLQMKKIVAGTAIGVGAVLGAGWVGLQVSPPPFTTSAYQSAPVETIAMPQKLPSPVRRYAHTTFGDRIPVIASAVITGRGRLRFGGIAFPARFRFTYLAGQGYRHYIEATVLGLPLLRVNEWYLDGHARLELPFGTIADEPKVDQAANLGLWGESFWLPSVLLTDRRVRWESVDSTAARLVVPFEQTEDEFNVTFDEQTGHLKRIEALRYRSATDAAKTPWQIDVQGWQVFHGVGIPTPLAVTWQDEGSPWLVMSLEDVTYNVDVSRSIRVSGP